MENEKCRVKRSRSDDYIEKEVEVIVKYYEDNYEKLIGKISVAAAYRVMVCVELSCSLALTSTIRKNPTKCLHVNVQL